MTTLLVRRFFKDKTWFKFHFILLRFFIQQTVSSTELTWMLFTDELDCFNKFIQLFVIPTIQTSKLSKTNMIRHQSNQFICWLTDMMSLMTFKWYLYSLECTNIILSDTFLYKYIRSGSMNFSISYIHRLKQCSKTW